MLFDYDNVYVDQGHTPLELTALIMPAANVQAYADTLTDALSKGQRHKIEIVWRQRGDGNLIEPGIPEKWQGEVHSLIDHAVNPNTKVLHLLFEGNNDPDSTDIYITAFPNPQAEYFTVRILPGKSIMSGIKAPAAPVTVTNAPGMISLGAPTQTPLQQAAQATAIQNTVACNEDAADALAGRPRRMTVCPGLKIPLYIPERHNFLYPHAFLLKPNSRSSWRDAFQEYMLNIATPITGETKRQDRVDHAIAIQGWFEQPPPTLQAKSDWQGIYLLMSKLVALHCFSIAGFSGESQALEAFTAAWDSGFVDFSAIIASVQTKKRSRDDKDQDKRAPSSFRGHGRGSNFSGRGAPKTYHGKHFEPARGRGAQRGGRGDPP